MEGRAGVLQLRPGSCPPAAAAGAERRSPGPAEPREPASIDSPWDLNSRSPAQSRDLRQEGEATVERGGRTTTPPAWFSGEQDVHQLRYSHWRGGHRAFSRAQPSASFPLCCRAAQATTRASGASRLPLRPELERGEESWKRSACLGCDCHPGAGARESEREGEEESGREEGEAGQRRRGGWRWRGGR